MKNYLKWFLILIPVVLVFKNLFLPGVLWGGDAPFFYPDAIKQLISKPNVFTERGIPFGGVNQLAWLWPLMYLFGSLGKFFGSDVALRVVFLFPSLILAGLGLYFLTKYLKFSGVVRFFAVLIYLLNTYYVLLIDGGQVGVALAYGIFPFTVLFLLKNNFLYAFLVSAALVLADPRIFVIAFLTVVFWQLLEKKFSWRLFYIIPLLVVINLYWLVPLLKNGILDISSGVNNLNLLSLINPLFLFSSHWPANIFGKIAYPPFYFAFVPILIFGSLFLDKSKQMVNIILLFLIFSFLSKGGSYPFGFVYDFVVNKVPLGTAFRDSSKFFIPVVLFGGILIGRTVELLPKVKVCVYAYILFLIFPAFAGKLNFLLSNHKLDPSFSAIYENLRADPTEFRTVWFPEKHPLSYETYEVSAINGRDLAGFRPFAAMNASEDVFNFLNNPKHVDWLGILGVKYLFLSGDPRNINPNESEVKVWTEVQKLVNVRLNLEKQNWGTSFETFKVPNVFPRTFTVDKLVAVVGSELSTTQPAIYFEDGKLNPEFIKDKDPNSIKIFFNGGEGVDLTMSFLQEFFKGSRQSISSQWANYFSDEYLRYKYELLIRGFGFNDFDYGKGVAFSTASDEKMKFRFDVPADGKYILATRRANLEKQKLAWEISERELQKGDFDFEVTNNSFLGVFNVAALVPKEEFEKAESLSSEFVARYGTIDLGQIKNAESSPGGFWKITTTTYNPTTETVPVYSMVNGYYDE